MDDFFKVLIWLIIIISFFSSFFRKKNKEGKKAPQNPQRNNPNTADRVDPHPKSIETKDEVESYNDILSEIESMFKNENVMKSKTSDKTKIEEHESQKKTGKYDIQWHKETTAEHTETASEHTLITDWEKKQKAIVNKSRVDFTVESKAKQFEEMINQSQAEDKFTQTVREKLRHPESLKDYIFISEIIGKPKAKRR